MEKSLQELEHILSREVEIHSSMVETAEAFNKAIKENDLTALQQHSSEQEKQIYQIEKLEEQRVECFKTISSFLGLPAAVSKLHQIIEKLPEQWRQKFSSIHTSLKQKINDLSKLNTSNQILIEEAIGFIGNTFSFLQQANGKFAQYGIKGRTAGTPSTSTLINKTA
jgi:flagellar biosynthesis/type III secretory pathway chaperone